VLQILIASAIALELFAQGCGPRAGGAAEESDETVRPGLVARFEEASWRAEELERNGSFYLAAREWAKVISLGQQVFKANDWRLREPELRLKFVQQMEALPADKYVEALQAQSDFKRAMTAFRVKGNGNETITFAEKARDGWQRIGAENTVKYLNTLTLIAKAYELQGASSSAIEAYQQELALSERVLGKCHPTLVLRRSNLGGVMTGSPRFYEAEPLLRTAFSAASEDYQRVGGEDESVVETYVICCRNMAGFHYWLDELAEAEQVYTRALDAVQARSTMREKSAVLLADLASTRLRQERPQDALRVATRAVELTKAAYHKEHVNSGVSVLLFADANLAANDPVRAEELLREAEQVLRLHENDPSKWPAAYTGVRAKLCLKKDQTHEAQQLLTAFLVRSEARFGPEHPALIRPLRTLAETKTALGLQPEAESLQRRAEQIEARREEYKRTRSIRRS
jgi:tetratricopeptide (TPR) repeat protein